MKKPVLMMTMWVLFGFFLVQPALAQELFALESGPLERDGSLKRDTKALVEEKNSMIVTPDYIIGAEDVLEVTVWRNPELSKVVQVRPDGRISLPLVGDVSAVGRTTPDLKEEILDRLKIYLEDPVVSLSVTEVNSYAIFMLGEVQAQGKMPLKSKTTLLQAITLAGGFTPLAARNKIVVFRLNKGGVGVTKIRASYDDIVLRDGADQNIVLKPGDQIVVPSQTTVVIPGR